MGDRSDDESPVAKEPWEKLSAIIALRCGGSGGGGGVVANSEQLRVLRNSLRNQLGGGGMRFVATEKVAARAGAKAGGPRRKGAAKRLVRRGTGAKAAGGEATTKDEQRRRPQELQQLHRLWDAYFARVLEASGGAAGAVARAELVGARLRVLRADEGTAAEACVGVCTAETATHLRLEDDAGPTVGRQRTVAKATCDVEIVPLDAATEQRWGRSFVLTRGCLKDRY